MISIFTHLERHIEVQNRDVEFFYTCRLPSSGDLQSILFLDRLHDIFSKVHAEQTESSRGSKKLSLHITGAIPGNQRRTYEKAVQEYGFDDWTRVHERRFTHQELISSLGPEENRGGTVAYVCGPPSMTDEVIDALRGAEGMSDERVLCEKWW